MDNEKPWLKQYPADIPTSIRYDEKPLHEYLEESASNNPKMKALYFMGREMTYEEVYNQALKVAGFLQSIGIEKGDRVAIMLPNTPQAVIGYYAVLLAGGIVVQTNPLYQERELEYQLQDSGAKVIICLDILLPRVSQVKKNTALDHIIVTQIKEYLPFPKNLIYPFIQKKQYNMVVKLEASADTHLWNQVISETGHDLKACAIDPKQDLALLQYTGGTTGYPKGVMLTHYNLVSNGLMSQAWLGSKQKRDIVMGVLPFFHVYGMTTVMNYSVMTGSKMILMPKFEPEDVLKTIEKQKPTVFPGAPTIYIALLHHPRLKQYDLSSIEACLSGSAPLPAEVQQQFQNVTKGKLVEGYGLTESSPVTHSNFLNGNNVNGSIGVPWPDTDVKIVDMETFQELPNGEVGEIAVKGPQVMKGYWNRKEETEQVLKNGWLLTGDIGYMDERGYFYVVDRKKDMIIAGGYNIYPREVEEVLYEFNGVQEVVIAGVPDEYRGETVKAYIVPKQGVQLVEKELDQFCRKRLAAYKVPRIYEFMDELPKTAVGKILRRKLVEEDKKKQAREATKTV
ncbi:long-chain-fatty-acid--CoA ligase [Sediminibacillus dalangtanensis]|uniref:Long-chain-fatty-acid--CoA ligase n=1 Tax=Sediminibacillus dalangtanensis TaxID=2729421 RepID=A0ABX7VU10_9BACI|nr:long-chain-fatty-acid--CoA ligase [Sediminibacillus dalangtanensis]QTN00014.1 long-chain-fatty-acid--CoA ligase [Sediminibacillus dalangtanensis]